jgi:hypothetical protein
MATTDARPGFKLPWSTDRPESDSTDAAPTHEAVAEGAHAEAQEATDEPGATAEPAAFEDASPVNETPTDAAQSSTQFDPWRLGDAPAAAAEPAQKRQPNKLMADLTKAMQTAAESTRDETLERLQADAKAHIETIHTRSATEAEELRQTADADIASIREWSKAEIARIREETDQKVTDRKATLEFEIEEHAARIEQRIERVQNHVAWFENEMASFFERLLAEEDATQLAAMAENLPEPPSFDDLGDLPAPAPAAVATAMEADAVAEAIVAEPAETESFQTETAEPPAAETGSFEAAQDDTATQPETVAEYGEGATEQAAEDPEAAFAAIQAAAEAAAANEAVEATGWSDSPAEAPTEVPDGEDGAPVDESDDPRLAMLGLSGDALAEPTTDSPDQPAFEAPGEEIATFSDDALAARLAGLVPAEGEVPQTDLQTTRVVVTGLVSVASIASFKRHLGKLEGVANVGVSSGPDGEFVFAVSHSPAVDLPQAVPAMPGFAAQITSVTDDTVSVAARDPETES